MDEIYFYREKNAIFSSYFQKNEREKEKRKKERRERKRKIQTEREGFDAPLPPSPTWTKKKCKTFFFCLAKMAAIYYLLLRRELQ